ncbi:MAG: tRNA epoxyqueuosine(34) reductase QueG [Chloroflexi bacterium]|nr:tRNA epoxyqueuosine(34) reductase QueG [Chloroflexota bacterium]
MVGVIPARPGRRLDAYMRWIEAGMHGRMGYLARPDRLTRRQDLDVILPDVQSIISVGMNYHTFTLPGAIANDPSRGRISSYAWNLDYHDIMTPRLQELAAWLNETTDSAGKVYVDTGAILERDHAESAGLGFTGKNTMLIHPRHGSYFFLGEILTTLKIDDSRLNIEDDNRQSSIFNPKSFPSCGTCHRCLDACPTNAFPESYVLDARRCISYLTIELKGWIPRELRPLLNNWVYGCDICQQVCPFNRFAQPTNEIAYYPRGKIHKFMRPSVASTLHNSLLEEVAPPLLDLLTLDDVAFNERFANSPIKRIKRTRLVRNACVAAGNWGGKMPVLSGDQRSKVEATVFPLIALLADPEPIIRGHAAWALQQIGGHEAETAVAQALQRETDELVRREMVI